MARAFWQTAQDGSLAANAEVSGMRALEGLSIGGLLGFPLGIVNGLWRAADVALKEKRRLVLAIRETPLHGGHLRTMATLADIGAVIAPIVPAFYNRPQSVDDIVNHTCGRLLDLFGIDTGTVKRWKGGPAEE